MITTTCLLFQLSQKEAVGDTYFAQVRRYDVSIGRFVSEIAATCVGNNIQRITSGLAHGDSVKEIAVDVVAGTAMDVVFGKLGAKMKKSPVTKELNKLFDRTNLSQIGKKVDS